MKLKSLHIKNFKSIVDLEIVEPNPFTVFVGPNGSGKSNIFEALEFMVYIKYGDFKDIRLMGGIDKLSHYNSLNSKFIFSLSNYDLVHHIENDYTKFQEFDTGIRPFDKFLWDSFNDWATLSKSFLRIFIKNVDKQKLNYEDDFKLNFSASNLEKVLKRILQDKNKREEIKEWLELFIPGFQDVKVNNANELMIYEKGIENHFPKDLLSDGTYNILALLAAVYQSDKPQFLCIEEPENGLNPYVIRKMVDFFRAACGNGHYIWLNTHSNALVECLTPEELIVVDKIGGETKIKQIKGMDLHGLDMAEVWLSGALGGGTPW